MQELGKSLCSAVSTAEGVLKSQIEAPVPESLSVVAFLHWWTAQLCSLSPLCSENQRDAFKTSELWFYHTDVTLPFCWIQYFSLMPKSPQQPVNTHHLYFSLLLHCISEIIGPFVEIIQTVGQNWGQQKLIQIESRAGLVDGVAVITLANVRTLFDKFGTFLFINKKFIILKTKSEMMRYGFMKSRAIHFGDCLSVTDQKAAEVSFFPSSCPSPGDWFSLTALVSEHLGL